MTCSTICMWMQQKSNNAQLLLLLQPFYGSLNFVWDNPGELVSEETFTHSPLLWSSMIDDHPSYASSIYYNPWHPPCSIYVSDSLFAQSLSKFSLVYLLAWLPPLHTPQTSSSNCCLLFAAHAHTIATCFAVLPRLCHLILASFSILYLVSFSLMPHIQHPYLCPLKCHLIFLYYGPGLTFTQHTTLHTTAVISVLIARIYFIQSNYGLHSCISISVHIQHVT